MDCVDYLTDQVILVTKKPQAEIEVIVRFQANKVPDAITTLFHKNVRNILEILLRRLGLHKDKPDTHGKLLRLKQLLQFFW